MDAEQAYTLNEVLLQTYSNILMFEQSAMSATRLGEITNNEVHTIAKIGGMKGGTMSEVASALGITKGTLTAAVDRLERKGYVERVRASDDRRHIRLVLTRKGRLIDRLHLRFHRELMATIANEFTEGESDVLLRALVRLNRLIFRLEEKR